MHGMNGEEDEQQRELMEGESNHVEHLYVVLFNIFSLSLSLLPCPSVPFNYTLQFFPTFGGCNLKEGHRKK